MAEREFEPWKNPLIAVISAPGRWMERSRGLTRLSFSLLAFLLMMCCALWIRHAASLNGLPAIAEPFDVEALHAARPAEVDNAFVLYRKAIAELPPETIDLIVFPPPGDDPFSADPYLQQIAARYPRALELFQDAADRPDAFAGDFFQTSGVLALVNVALAEGSRLQGKGDLSGAWKHYRAALRAGRHLGQRAGWLGRIAGIDLVQRQSTDRIVSWADQSKVEHDLLKSAIADVEALDAMTPPGWLTMQYEYLDCLDRLAHATPGQRRPELRGSQQLDAFFRNEPERSRRILRLIFANWLAEWSLPDPSRTHRVITGTPPLFDNPDAPRSARLVPPARLQEWYASSDLAVWHRPLIDYDLPELKESLEEDQIVRANLIVHLAERRYVLDHKEPPTYPEELLGLYLDRIPSAYLPSRSLRSPSNFENTAPSLDTSGPSP